MSLMRAGATVPSVEADFLNFRMARFTGTTAATEGGNVDFAHGLPDINKIVGWKALVRLAANELITENERNTIDREFHAQVNTDTDFRINLAAVNSADILSKPFEVMIFYTN